MPYIDVKNPWSAKAPGQDVQTKYWLLLSKVKCQAKSILMQQLIVTNKMRTTSFQAFTLFCEKYPLSIRQEREIKIV